MRLIYILWGKGSSHAKLCVLAATLFGGCVNPAWGQNINTTAGDGTPAFFGDGGPATLAALNLMKGLAIDSTGNLYIADTENFRVREVSSTGIISTVAGNGSNAYSGDGGSATSAALSDVMSVAVDSSGNIYIADASNRRIRKVTPGRIISTIAGTGTQGYTGDGGPAVNAELGRPVALMLDPSGNLYYVDSVNAVVRKISTSGTITTVIGSGVTGYSGDGGSATAAKLAFPLGIAMDGSGNIYIADANNNVVRKVTAGGIISTFAGNGAGKYAGDGGPAASASLNIPSDVAVDAAGNVYIADAGNNRVRKVSGGIITTVAGIDTNGFAGDGGPAIDAMLNYPWGLTTDSEGNVYLADRVNNRIREIQSGTPLGAISLRSSSPVVNGASFASGVAIAPGAIVSIFGSNLAAGTASYTTAPLPDVLAQTSVTFNGTEAPLFYVSGSQINAQAPFNLLPGSASIQVTRGTETSSVANVNVASFSPGIFIIDSNNSGAFLNASTYATISSTSPAAPGNYVAIYCTGLGAVNQTIASGAIAPTTNPAQTITSPTVTVGGKNAVVSFSGLAPGYVGLYQINIVVPAGLTPGPQPVQIAIGGALSNSATMYVAQ